MTHKTYTTLINAYYLLLWILKKIPWDEKQEAIKASFPYIPIPPNTMSQIDAFQETEDYIYFTFWHNGQVKSFIMNNQTNKTKIFTRYISNDLWNAHLPWIPLGFYEDDIIVNADAFEFLKPRNKIDYPKDLTADSNPALIFFRPIF